MRALFFARPLEYRLEVPGEEFIQGQGLAGTLCVTNRDSTPHKKLSLEIGLAYGVFKDIKESGNKALQILERARVADGFSLKPGEEKKADWELPLGNDAPTLSKEGGPFLVYGADLSVVGARGQIDLPVELSPPASAFITTLENHFAFEARSRKCTGGVVEVRLKPPASYPALEELTVLMRIDEKTVKLELRGKSRGLKAGEPGTLISRKKSVKTSIPLAKFGFGGALLNRALYRETVDTLLPQIAVRMEKNRP